MAVTRLSNLRQGHHTGLCHLHSQAACGTSSALNALTRLVEVFLAQVGSTRLWDCIVIAHANSIENNYYYINQ